MTPPAMLIPCTFQNILLFTLVELSAVWNIGRHLWTIPCSRRENIVEIIQWNWFRLHARNTLSKFPWETAAAELASNYRRIFSSSQKKKTVLIGTGSSNEKYQLDWFPPLLNSSRREYRYALLAYLFRVQNFVMEPLKCNSTPTSGHGFRNTLDRYYYGI